MESRAQRRAQAAQDPLGTARGLERAEEVHEEASQARFARMVRLLERASDLEAQARLEQGDEPTSRGVLEDHPRLDLGVLAANGYCRPREESYGVVDWAGAGSPIDTLQFVISLVNSAEPFIELEASSGASRLYQTLRQVDRGVNGRTRWCFVCPISGTPVEVVAFRGRGFASARTQRLANRSQHQPKARPKMRRKAVRLSRQEPLG